jgi:hypothetical protein
MNRPNELTFLNKECMLDLRKTYAGCFSPEYQRLVVECSTGDDDKSYRDVHSCLPSDQQDKLQAWLLSKEHELTFTDDDRTMSLRRSATGLDMKYLDPQWLDPEGRKSKPIVVKLEMTLDPEQVEKLSTWLSQPYMQWS